MASDLIERLRERADTINKVEWLKPHPHAEIMREAATALAIEREGHAAARQNFHTMQLAADELRKQRDAWIAKTVSTEASLAEAKRLLKPFADAAQCLDAAIPDLKDTRGWTFQAIDFRAAARFLAQEEARPTEEPQR